MRPYEFPLERMLADLSEVAPEVRMAPHESWAPNGYPVIFEDSCGCHSDCTTDSCGLTVFLAARDPSPQLRQALEAFLREWAKDHLDWSCCSCCCPDKETDSRVEACGKGHCLSVDVRLFTLAGSGPVQ